MDQTDQIRIVKAKIALLDVERRRLVQNLQDLQEKSILKETSESRCLYLRNSVDHHTEERIKLFRSLFHGRNDVYARLWVSRKTGKSGYAPVCKNEWKPKICQKPAAKCYECPNRELSPLDDDVVSKYLKGESVVGIYPMMQDETCHFLAVDFDKEGWRDNISAFKETCLRQGVPVAIERSRSGNGAHAWIFFEQNVPAIIARKMGSFLITETMSKRYQLDIKSYDRLFPNQDTLPKGGFGNLIALPFQKEMMMKGNTVFIDDNYNPYVDQWEFLSGVKRMSLSEIETISREASASGKVIGVRMSPVDENDPPWMKLPSGKKRYKAAISNLPAEIEVVMADKIYIKVKNLPSVFLNQVKRLAAFQNPEFYRRQSMRLSTSLTPRVICCSEIEDGYLSLPRGCIDDLYYLMEEYGIRANLKDERIPGKKIRVKFFGSMNLHRLTAVVSCCSGFARAASRHLALTPTLTGGELPRD